MQLVLRQAPTQGGELGRGGDAELADELPLVVGVAAVVPGVARVVVGAVVRAETDAVPHLPGVPVAVQYAVGRRPALTGVLAPRAARPVRSPAVELGDGLGQDAVEEVVAPV